jgi:hypothetical protein
MYSIYTVHIPYCIMYIYSTAFVAAAVVAAVEVAAAVVAAVEVAIYWSILEQQRKCAAATVFSRRVSIAMRRNFSCMRVIL